MFTAMQYFGMAMAGVPYMGVDQPGIQAKLLFDRVDLARIIISCLEMMIFSSTAMPLQTTAALCCHTILLRGQ